MRPLGAGDEVVQGEGLTRTQVGEATSWWPGLPTPCRASPSAAAGEGPLVGPGAADAVKVAEDEGAEVAEVVPTAAGILLISMTLSLQESPERASRAPKGHRFSFLPTTLDLR